MPKCGRSRNLIRRRLRIVNAHAASLVALAACLATLAALSGFAQSPASSTGSHVPTVTAVAVASERLVVGDFSGAAQGSIPGDWRPLTFPDIKVHTRYSAVTDPQHGQVVRADAVASASGLMHKLALDTRAWPLLQWSWKADRLVAKADLTRKDGDDYPARIYVSFAYDPQRVAVWERALYAAAKLVYGEYPPQSGLNYVWDGKAPIGTVAPNAYTRRVRMIVVESGPAHLGEWRSYERNIADDYRQAFGEEPPAISGVAIMTDTDNTGESATAWYGNITLRRAPP